MTPPSQGHPLEQTRRTLTHTWHTGPPPIPSPRAQSGRRGALCAPMAMGTVLPLPEARKELQRTAESVHRMEAALVLGKTGQEAQTEEGERISQSPCSQCHWLLGAASVLTHSPNAKWGPHEKRMTCAPQEGLLLLHSTCWDGEQPLVGFFSG